MKIEQIEIYGFGKWIDVTFDFSEEMFTCLYGENEAGKSTLQQFLLYMLFGFPPKLRNFYRPKQSNRIGGKLTLSDGEVGTYIVERVEDEVRCYDASGEKHDEKFLQERLNGLTKEIFTSIYSFSALDLQKIREMKGKELSDVLFSVGLTGATSIYEVEKHLEKELGELYKKSGRKPEINQQLKKVSEMYSTLQKNRSLESSYQDKVEQKTNVENEGREIEKKIRTLKEKLLKLERFKQVYPLVKEYEMIEEKLANFEKSIPFPEDGVKRYDSLKQQLLPLKSDLKMIRKAQKDYAEKIYELDEKLLQDELLIKGKKLIQQSHQVEVRKERLTDLQLHLREIEEKIAEVLRTTSLTEEEVKSLHLPFHLEKKWQTISDTNDQLQLESERITEEYQLLNEELDRLRQEEEKLVDELLPEEARTNVEERIEQFITLEAERKQNEKLLSWHKKRKKTNQNLLIGTAMMAFFSFISIFFIEHPIVYSIPAIFIFISIWQFVLLKRVTNEINNLSKKNTVKVSLSERKELEQLLAKQRQLEAEYEVIKSEQKRLQLHQIQLEERKKIFEQNESKWMSEIFEEQQRYPFLKATEPAYWSELLQLLRKLKSLLSEKEQIREQIRTLKGEKEIFYQSLQHFSEMIHFDGEFSIETLKDILEEQQSLRQILSQYRQFLEEKEMNEKQLLDQISLYEREIIELFQIAQVADEEQFFQRANELKEQKNLLEQKDSILQQILLTISEEELKQMFIHPLQKDEMTLQHEQMIKELENLEEEKIAKNKQIAQLQVEIEQLEISDDPSTTTYLYEMEKDKLNQLAKKWAILKYAQSALTNAKRSYQEKYLHEVIDYTTKYFRRLTNGKYRKVFAPTDTELFQVEAENNIRYNVEELSKGTIDQLYISLRLAISKVMSDKFVVPIIIDDAFVHFDDHRTKEMVEILKEIASTRQILLFTCKKEIAHQFEYSTVKKLKEVV